jgi:hypothetical protein
MTNLYPKTKYYYQTVAYVFGNASDNAYGSISNFTTQSGTPPTVTSTGVTGLSGNSATANGTFNPNGSDTHCYFNYGTSTSYGLTTPVVDEGSGTTTSPFSATLTPLTPDVTYHYQMVAYNSAGTNYGTDVNFTPVLPTATTGTSTPVSSTSETVNGSVTPNGWGVTAYFQYGTNTSYGQTAPSTYWTESGSSTVPLSTTLTGLNPNTLYHYTIVTYITAFANIFTGGGDQTFTTAPSPTVSTPTISPNGGNFSNSASVTLTCFTTGATIFYTTNGTTPTTSSAIYSSPFDLNGSATVEAMATLAGYNNSTVASASFTFTVATPTISPNGGTFTGSQQVTLACPTTGATIYYTSNGTTPTTSSAVYNNTPFTLANSATVEAMAAHAGYNNSQVTSASFTDLAPVSPSLSTLTATPRTAPADGSSQITATVTLRDIYTNPVSGKMVQFYASEVNNSGIPVAGSLQFQGSVNPTGGNGQTTAALTANTPGTVTITAKDTTDNVAVQQPATVTFTNTGAPIPTPLVLSNAINTFYQETANILDGSVGYNTTTTPYFSVSPIPWIAPDEGQVGDAFEVAAGAAKSAKVIDLAFGFVGVTASPVKIVGQVGLALAQSADNYAADQVDWIATNSDGLTLEAQAVINVASANQNFLQGEKDFFLNTVPQSSANMSALYTNDLQMRLYANYVLVTVLGKEDALLDNLQSASKNNAINSDLLDVAEVGGALIVIGLTAGTATPLVVALSVGYTSATTGIGEYEDNQSVNDNQKAYLYAFSSMQTCANYSGLIYSNATSAFSQIAQGLAPNPVTGLIIGLQPVVQCNLEPIPTDPSSAFQPKDETTTYQYALIPTYDSSSLVVSNSGSTAATFEVFACYNSAANAFNANTSVPLVNIAAINLNTNQSGTLVIPYFDNSYGVRPAEGSTVSMYVLGINATGTFYVASTNFTWSTEADAPCLSSGAGSSIATPAAKPHPLDDPNSTTNNTYVIDNPIRYFVAENPDNQTYQEQLSYCNPFFGNLLAVVTQTLPSGIAVLRTDGTQVNSSIVWTNILAPNTVASGKFTFSLSATPGSQTNLPPPTILFVDTNTADNFSAAPSVQKFNGLFPVQVSSSMPIAVWGIDSPMLVAVTNLTGASQTGYLTITLTNSSGNVVTHFSQSFSLSGSGGTNLNFILPDSLPADSYTLSGSLNINGGTGQVLAGNYVVPAQPVTLGVGSPAIDANGIHIVLNGPPGSNYVITATSNLSDPTTRQAIMFLSPTNTPISITVPMATNASQMFYQAVMQ